MTEQKNNTNKIAYNSLINSRVIDCFGTYYFNVRYYKPPTFTSRDPLFEKYPSISPYAYCANNPVKYVDPTGCEMEVDDYKIDKQGNISLLRKTDDNFDVLYNQEQTSGIQLDKGILNNKQSGKDSRGNKYDYFKITNKEKASELFKFFTKYTEVEWSKLDCGKNLDYISTSHSETKEAGGSDLLYKRLLDKKYVKELMHSHPNAPVAAPSGFLKDDKNSGDRDLAKWLYKYYPEKQIKLKVYDVKQNVIINYNDKSFWIE